jgi:hypothetical protein
VTRAPANRLSISRRRTYTQEQLAEVAAWLRRILDALARGGSFRRPVRQPPGWLAKG